MGSVTVAAWIAALAFPTLLVWGLAAQELGPRTAFTLAAIAIAPWFGLPRLSSAGGYLVTPALAVLDIVLVLMVFKRDIRIG